MQTSWKDGNSYLRESSPKKKIEYMVRVEDPSRDKPVDSYFYTYEKAKEYKNSYINGLKNYDWLKQTKLKKFANTPAYAEKVWNDLLTNGVKIYRVITNFVEVEEEDDIPSLFTDKK